jgi:ADP-ribose pyrophosphatase YjhB (NUDIX family)
MEPSYFYKSLFNKPTEIVEIKDTSTSINSQNLSNPNTTADPLSVAILSAVAGAITGAIATETIKSFFSRLSTFNMQWKNKRAERMLVAISVIQSGKLILMTKRNQNNDQNLTWCFPAARINQNEVIVERLKARYKEKFNIEVKILKQIGDSYIKNKDLKLIYFHCQYEKGSVINVEQQENEEVKWIDSNEVESLVTTRIDPAVTRLISKIQRS